LNKHERAEFQVNTKPGWLTDAEEYLRGERILVTGATGFIGSNLALRLKEIGAAVFALEHTPDSGRFLAGKGIEIVRGDIADLQRIDQIVKMNFGSIAHLATWSRGRALRDSRSVNVRGTRYLAQQSALHGNRRFLYTSSIAAYGAHGDSDVDESTPVYAFGDPYGDSKIDAETAIQEVGRSTGLEWVIVRPGMVYGPGSKAWTQRIAQWAKQGRIPIVDGGRGTAYPIFIGNLIDLLIVCLARPEAAKTIVNGIDDGVVPLGVFLGSYMRMIPTSRAIRLPGALLSVAAHIIDPFSRELKLSFVVDQMRGCGRIGNRVAHGLGWEPRVSLDEGLMLSEQWLRAEGLI